MCTPYWECTPDDFMPAPSHPAGSEDSCETSRSDNRRPKHVLLHCLDTNVAAGRVVRWPPQQDLQQEEDRCSYTGYMTYADLKKADLEFAFMNTNRVVDGDTVRQRVEANELEWARKGRWLDFGTVILIVRTDAPADTHFLVMDGQHRVRTMQTLFERYPDRPITFHFRAVTADSDARAATVLSHFQDCLPNDPRTFFPTLKHNEIASAVVCTVRERFPSAWRSQSAEARRSRQNHTSIRDPPRPYLSEGLLYDIMRSGGALETDTVGEACARLLRINEQLSTWTPARLGATEAMVRKAQGCFLGFVRRGKLEIQTVVDAIAEESSTPPPKRLKCTDGTDAATSDIPAAGVQQTRG